LSVKPPDGLEQDRQKLQQASLQHPKGEHWADLTDLNITCSPQKAKLDDNLAFTVSFKLRGGLRRNYVRSLWEKAYDDHDMGFRVGYWVSLVKRKGRLLSVEVKKDKFVRRGVFFWTRNPELPYRVWATVATEFETILYPKTEEEAQNMLFDVTRTFEVPAKKLGRGQHSVAARVGVKWGKHVFTERGQATAKSPTLKVQIE